MAVPALRAALLERYPWLASTDVGPQAVEAGECDRCGQEARLVLTCGPSATPSLGRRCALERGTAAWCAGHEAKAEESLVWLAALPPEADVVARLWWVATGEVKLEPALHRQARQLGVLARDER